MSGVRLLDAARSLVIRAAPTQSMRRARGATEHGRELSGHSGGEAERLTIARQDGDDLADLLAEALVQQAVPLVEDQRLQPREPRREPLVLHVIPQPAGRGDEQVHLP